MVSLVQRSIPCISPCKNIGASGSRQAISTTLRGREINGARPNRVAAMPAAHNSRRSVTPPRTADCRTDHRNDLSEFCHGQADTDGIGYLLHHLHARDLFEAYGVDGVDEKATYVIRPDGHVLARCPGLDPSFAASAIESALAGGSPANLSAVPDAQLERDRLYDACAALVDEAAESERRQVLEHAMTKLTRQLERT